MTTATFSHEEIIKGERIQKIADIYLGMPNDFVYNPSIATDTTKHYDIRRIVGPFSNPPVVFCYGHLISVLADKIHFFQNSVVLITHNSDYNITLTPEIDRILNQPVLRKWYAQNVGIHHPKLHVLPIGLANDQWAHGDVSFFRNPENAINAHNVKTESVYFYFKHSTNYVKRTVLCTYSFCICPEGNGADTHRFWEALYVKCVPIVLRTTYIEVIQKQFPDLPMVVLDSWADFDMDTLVYNYTKMSLPNYYDTLKLSYLRNLIRNS